MILRTQEDYDEARRLKTPVYCSVCKEPVGYEYLRPGEGAWLTECCDAVAYVQGHDGKLVDTLGPAFRTFIPVPPALLADRTLTLAERAVAEALLGYVHLPEVRPKQETLAAEAGVNERTCRNALSKLERRGLIHRTPRGRQGGRLPDLIDIGPLLKYVNSLPANAAGSDPLPAASDPLPANLAVTTGKKRHPQPAGFAGDVDVVDVDVVDVDRARLRHVQPDEVAADNPFEDGDTAEEVTVDDVIDVIEAHEALLERLAREDAAEARARGDVIEGSAAEVDDEDGDPW